MTRLRPFAATLTLALAVPAVAMAQDAPREAAPDASPVPIQIEIDVAAEEAERDEAKTTGEKVETEDAAEGADVEADEEERADEEPVVEGEDPLPGGVVALPEPEAPPARRAPSVRVTVDVPPPPPSAVTLGPGGEVPDGYYLKHRRRKGLMIAGGVTFGVTWLASIAAARYRIEERDPGFFDRAEDGEDVDWPAEASLMIPVAGPWMALAQLDDASGRDKALIAGSGLAQLGGLAMLGVGLFYEDTVLVKKETVEVSAAPLLAPGVAGAALTGSF